MPVKILMSDHGIGRLYDKFATETLGKMLDQETKAMTRVAKAKPMWPREMAAPRLITKERHKLLCQVPRQGRRFSRAARGHS